MISENFPHQDRIVLDLEERMGLSESRNDAITQAPVRALAATLDCPGPELGGILPALWHWLYFLPYHRADETGPDGHAHRGRFFPPVSLQRRMWAGGRLVWEPGNPLKVGDAARRTSHVASVAHKNGRSGELLFVTVVHELHNAKGLILTEEQDIVYCAMSRPDAPAPAPVPASASAPLTAQAPADWERELTPDEVLLFRYSALTFNSHRIHYDRPYATQVEAYPGLIVHGPLIATLLLDLVRREAPSGFVRRFEFKAVRPSFAGNPLRLRGQPQNNGTVRLWAQDPEGWLAMQATAEIE